MEKWEALLKFQNAIERVQVADQKIRNVEADYPDTSAAHLEQWTESRAASAELAVEALAVLQA